MNFKSLKVSDKDVYYNMFCSIHTESELSERPYTTGKRTLNLSYVVDTTTIAGSEEEMIKFFLRIYYVRSQCRDNS